MKIELILMAERLGWVLLHSLWQGVLIAGLLALALRWVRSASLRHLLCIGAMTGLLVVGIATFFSLTDSTTVFDPSSPPVMDTSATATATVTAPKLAGGEARPGPAMEMPVEITARPAFDPAVLLVIGSGIWAIGFLLCIIRRFLAFRRLRKWRSASGASLPEKLEQAAGLARAKLAGAERVAIRICDEVAAPVIHGLVKPVIFIPLSIATNLGVHELELILTHELAHWRRRDTWFHTWQLVLDSLFFYHPASWWMSRMANRAREEAADDLVLETGASRRDYARVLADLAARQVGLVPEASLAASGNHVAQRIRRFLSKPPEREMGPSRSDCWILGAVAFALTGVLTSFQPAARAETGTAEKSEPIVQAQDEQVEGQEAAKRISGYLEPWRSVTVTWPGTENLAKIHVEEGAEVKKGDPLASLDTTVLEKRLRIATLQAQSNAVITMAEADHKIVLQRQTKLQTLRQRGTVSSSELDRATAAVVSSTANLQQAREEKSIAELRVEEIEAQIESRHLRSPINGVVVALNLNPDKRSANQIRVVQVDKLALEVSIPAGKVGDMKKGDDIRVILPNRAGSDTEVKGRLEFISPEVDTQKSTVIARISVPNRDRKLQSASPAFILLTTPGAEPGAEAVAPGARREKGPPAEKEIGKAKADRHSVGHGPLAGEVAEKSAADATRELKEKIRFQSVNTEDDSVLIREVGMVPATNEEGEPIFVDGGFMQSGKVPEGGARKTFNPGKRAEGNSPSSIKRATNPDSIRQRRMGLKKNSGSETDHLKLGRDMISEGMHEESIEFLEEATALFPDNPEFHWLLTFPLRSLENYKEAVPHFEACEEIAKQHQPEMLTENFYYSYGSVAERSGDVERAARCFKQAIEWIGKQEPDNRNKRFAARVYNYLGYMWLVNDTNLDEAGEWIQKASELDPESSAIADSLGWFLFKKGRFDEAREELLRAESLLEKPDAVILEHLARTFDALGDKDKAKAYRENALSVAGRG